MNILLVRVAADQSPAGGRLNGPVDCASGKFVYVPIPENRPVHPGLERPYAPLQSTLQRLNADLPAHLSGSNMHLDPDFERLTYGDTGQRGDQIRKLQRGDWLVFYAGLVPVPRVDRLLYGLIGRFVIAEIVLARELQAREPALNAHTRRRLESVANDVVVLARPGESGRLGRCIPIGEYRDRAYRVRADFLEAWGGLSVKNGYLQRSARLPRLLDPARFADWFETQRPELVADNNP